MAQVDLSPEFVSMMAERFKALAEPARLYIVYALNQRELTVTELVDATGMGQANVSKHLQVLHTVGFVKRRKNGLFVHYALVDQRLMKLCRLMHERLDTQLEQERLIVPE